MSPASPEVVVVGGGAAGACAALALADRGAPVTVLDRPAMGRATGAAAGMLAPQYEGEASDPLFRLGLASRERYGAFAARVEELSGLDLGYRTDGMLVTNRTADETETAREALDRQRSAGGRGELLEPVRARSIHPEASPAADSYLWLPDEGQVDAQRLHTALSRALPEAGIRLRPDSPVARLATGADGTEVVLADGGRLRPDAVVLAAGAWTSQMEGLPRRLGVEPVKGQMVRLEPTEPPPWPLLADHEGHYLVPRDDGSVLVGSTMERAGFDAAADSEVAASLEAAAVRLAPWLAGAARLDAWAGLRPVAAGDRPVLGPDPLAPGLYYATGYGRHGILLSPLAGRAVAELILDGSSDVEWEPFSPERLPPA